MLECLKKVAESRREQKEEARRSPTFSRRQNWIVGLPDRESDLRIEIVGSRSPDCRIAGSRVRSTDRDCRITGSADRDRQIGSSDRDHRIGSLDCRITGSSDCKTVSVVNSPSFVNSSRHKCWPKLVINFGRNSSYLAHRNCRHRDISLPRHHRDSSTSRGTRWANFEEKFDVLVFLKFL